MLKRTSALSITTFFIALSFFHFSSALEGFWNETGQMNVGRGNHTSTLLLDGRVLVTGGNLDPSNATPTTELYDPGSGTWSITSAMNSPRVEHSATLLPDGKVLVTGGVDNNNFVPTAELYDPSTGTWTPTGTMANGRAFHTALLLPNGKVLVSGGRNFISGALASAELYDPTTGLWTVVNSMMRARQRHTATLLSSGLVLVAGGLGNGPSASIEVELFNPATGQWTAAPSMTVPHYYHTATLLQDGTVLVAGGGTSQGGGTTTAELYNPALNTWEAIGSMIDTRSHHTAQILSNGKVLVAGGYAGNSQYLTSAEVYDPMTRAWSVTDSMNDASIDHEMTMLLNGKVLVTGGYADVWFRFKTAQLYEVAAQNNSPSIVLNNNQTFYEGLTTTFIVSATDPDVNDVVTLSATNLPSGATFDTQTGVFAWTPGFDDAGTYSVTFTATDNGIPTLSDSETVVIDVQNTNRAPLFTPIGDKTVAEGALLQFTVSAVDADGDTLTYVATNIPSGSTFNAETRVFSWTPTFAQEGNYVNVEFTVTDDGSPIELDVEFITISVGNVNRPPVFETVPTQEILEGQTLSFIVSATDPDGDVVTLSSQNLPLGASFIAQTGAYSWTPTLAQSGTYVLTFVATDSGTPQETQTIDVVITVGDDPTPLEQAENIVTTVVSYAFPTSIENSYMANLKKVGKFIEEGKITAAVGQLNAFIEKVHNDYLDGDITLTIRNNLVGLAQALIADLQ